MIQVYTDGVLAYDNRLEAYALQGLTITTALKDPDSMNGEEERYSVDNVALDSLPLVNYATGKVNEQVIPFRFLPGDLKQLSAIHVTEVA